MLSKKNCLLLIIHTMVFTLQLKASLQFLEPEKPFTPRYITKWYRLTNLYSTKNSLGDIMTNVNMSHSDRVARLIEWPGTDIISKLTEYPVADNIVAPILNYIFPNNFFSAMLFSNKAMHSIPRYILYDDLLSTFTLFKEKLVGNNSSFEDKRIFNVCITCLTVLPVYVASHTHPALFEQYTFFNATDLLPFQPWSKFCCIYLKQCNTIVTTNPNLDIFTTGVKNIFKAKKILFLTCIILSSLYLKPKNDLFTKPQYWLTIGIAHAVWQPIISSHTFKQRDLSSFLLKTYMTNIIPITAAFVHTLYVYRTE